MRYLLSLLLCLSLTIDGITDEHPTVIDSFSPDGPALQEGSFMGWPAISLHNGRLAATFVPEIGRLVAFGPIQGGNRLWLNPSLFPRPETTAHQEDSPEKPVWRNYGGFKIWPYPWTGWPPDSALDGGVYSLSKGADWLRLDSARSQALDTQVWMRAHLHDEVLTLQLGMDSSSQRALWPVVQVPGSARCIIPLADHEALSEVVSSPQVAADDLRQSLSPLGNGWYSSEHVAEHRKFDVSTSGGWIASVDEQRGNLRLRWPYPHPQPPNKNHDGSFYFNDTSDPAQQYLELECYSPLQEGQQEWTITLDLAKDLLPAEP